MTAEIAVLNSTGIALAADSAVTIGRGDKIYPSADKLFHLVTTKPVAIMIYGGATTLRLPWETVIKSYRQQASGVSFDTVVEYAEDFFKFFESQTVMFDEGRRDRAMNQSIAYFCVGVMDDLRAVSKRHRSKHGEANIATAMRERLLVHLAEVESLDVADGVPEAGEILERFATNVGHAKEQFGKIGLAGPEVESLVDRLIVARCSRMHEPNGATGFVVAGFGERDYEPAMVEYSVDGLWFDKCRRRKLSEHIVATEGAGIQAFAQSDVVQAFLTGVSSGTLEGMRKATSNTIGEITAAAISHVHSEHGDEAANAIQTVLRDVAQEKAAQLGLAWNEVSRESWSPIVELVEVLPKEQLASMAESLVDLTKLRRRISNEEETVGGPIDVALITKGDGFVWVQRKHYYDPMLNIRAMARYFKEDC